MSWINDCVESNKFQVKNTKEVIKVLEEVGFVVEQEGEVEPVISFYSVGEGGPYVEDDIEVVLSLKPREDETNLVGCIGYFTSITLKQLLENNNLKEEGVVVQNIVEYLQDQIIDEKQAVVITTAGFESRVNFNFNPFGDVFVISKNNTFSKSLYSITQEILQENNLTQY